MNQLCGGLLQATSLGSLGSEGSLSIGSHAQSRSGPSYVSAVQQPCWLEPHRVLRLSDHSSLSL